MAERSNRRLVTCVYCDLVGSTALAERVDAELLRDLMVGYYEQMELVVQRHGGRVEKFIGDAVAAVWGIPTTREDDAVRAVRAAVEMTQVADTLRPGFEAAASASFGVRVGVSSGEVLVSARDAARTAVLGDAMNTAARLQATAAAGEVVIGDLTYRLTGGWIKTEEAALLELKGKAGRTAGYRVSGVRASAPAVAHAAPLTGRDGEMAELEAVFSEAATGCRLVLLVGEPGVGKSRLMAEFTHGRRAFHGRCLSYGEGIAYWPIAEIVRAAAGFDWQTPAADARRRIAALFAGEPDARRAAAVLAQAIGLEEDSGRAGEIPWAARRLLRVLGATGEPPVIVIDDLQWAEGPLLEIVVSLPDTLPDVPLLVVCLARPELLDRHGAWPLTVRVDPLGSADALRLVAELWPAADEAVVGKLAGRSGGNPLFAEELVGMVADGGHDNTAELPDSLRALLGARLDLLAPEPRAVAERGAVEGEVLHEVVVRELTPAEGRGGLPDALSSLVDEGLIRQQPDGATVYRFHHALVRDAVYAATPKRARSELHARLGRWITSEAGSGLVGIAATDALAGEHLEQAVRYRAELEPLADHELARQAARHLARAGARSRAMGDVAAATSLMGRAWELLADDDPERLDIAPALGAAMSQTGRLDDSIDLLTAASAAARASGDTPRALRCELELHEVRGLRADPGWEVDTSTAASSAIELFGPLQDHAGLARAWYATAHVAIHGDDNESMAVALERSALEAQLAGEEWHATDSLSWLALITWVRPRHVTQSLADLDVIRGRAPDSQIVEAAVLVTRGVLLAMRCEFELARTTCARGRQMFRDLGQVVGWGGTVLQAGLIETLAGDHVAAEWLYRPARDALDGAPSYQITVSVNLGHTLFAQGRYAEAEALCEEAERFEDTTDVVVVCGARELRGLLHAQRGEHTDALRCSAEALAMTDAAQSPDSRIEALFVLAEIQRRAGEREPLRAALAELETLLDTRGNLALEPQLHQLQRIPAAAD